MGIYNVHGGHNYYAPGAKKYLDEVKEDRIVKNEVIKLLRQEGHTVYDCTDEDGKNKNAVLYNIVKKCNAHSVDLDISIHLNAGGGSGVEVWNYDARTKDISDRICYSISKELDIPNRGTKYTQNLYVLSNTKSKAILIECCFTDSASDYDAWSGSRCAKAIVEGILGKHISSEPGSAPDNNDNTEDYDIDVRYSAYARTNKWRRPKWQDEVTNAGGGVDGYAGVIGQPLLALQAYTVGDAKRVGKLKYRLRPLGNENYWSWQTDKETDKYGETWAGNKKTTYDGLQMTLEGTGSHEVQYRVYCAGKWQDWVTDCGDGYAGYAGIKSHAIQAVQIRII